MLDEMGNLPGLLSGRPLSSPVKRRVYTYIDSHGNRATAKFSMDAVFDCLFVAFSARLLRGLRLFG
jgi:hypothetical protein